MKKQKKITKSQIWKLCSKYIRLHECLETTGTIEYGKCCTCGGIFPFELLDAGHFISGRRNSILFYEKGIHIQCRYCNRFCEGNKESYNQYMLHHYGQSEIDKIQALNKMSKSLGQFELLALKQNYQNEIKRLLKNGT